jgi:hypothetical protein
MFWSAVLPFFVTSGLLFVAIMVATAIAPRKGWRRGRVLRQAIPASMIIFVPSCAVVMRATNAVRFGVGRYDDVGAIWDTRFKRWLPESATDIVLNKHRGGYDARYHIDRPSLDAWFDQCWENAREPAAPRTAPAVNKGFDPAVIEQRFGPHADRGPQNGTWVEYEGPRRSNWAGATTWFDEQSGVAYQDVGFW